MRVALYARVSTDKQAEKYGIASQVEAMLKRCTEKNWNSIHDGDRSAFIDDGYTGAELDRPALSRLRKLVKEGKVDIVLAYDPDRLSRRLYHLMILADELEKQGVKLEFITQEMGTSPEDRMFFNMRGAIAEYEREKIRERTMRGRREKARQGKVSNAGVAPLGFRFSKAKQTLEEDPQTAETARFIFTTFVNDRLSLTKLASRMSLLGIKTPRGSNRWSPSTLTGILSNEAYIGRLYQFRQYHVPSKRGLNDGRGKKTSMLLRPRDEWIVIPVPAIVPLDLFEAAQRQLRTNSELAKRNTKREYLLVGILHCGFCGGRMGGHDVYGITYYRCYRRRPERYMTEASGESHPCPCPEVRTDGIDKIVWKTVTNLLKKPETLITELKKCREPDSSTRQAVDKELRLSIQRLESISQEEKRLVEGYSKGLYNDSMMHEQMEALEREQTELNNRKLEQERQLEARALTENQEMQIRGFSEKVKSGLDNLDFRGKQDLLRLLVERVNYDAEKIEIQTVLTINDKLNTVHRRG